MAGQDIRLLFLICKYSAIGYFIDLSLPIESPDSLGGQFPDRSTDNTAGQINGGRHITLCKPGVLAHFANT